MNNELTQIIYSIIGSSYIITKDDLCKAICATESDKDYPRCRNIQCANCPILASINDMEGYPSLVIKVRKLLNES